MATWLIAEDEDDIRNLLTMVVQLWGKTPIAFDSGTKAWEWIDRVNEGIYEGEIPELALLDIRMPGKRGDEIAKRIRSIPYFNSTGVVIMTAFSLGEDELLSFFNSSRFDFFINKPLPDFDNLRSLLAGIVSLINELRDYSKLRTIPSVDFKRLLIFVSESWDRHSNYPAPQMRFLGYETHVVCRREEENGKISYLVNRRSIAEYSPDVIILWKNINIEKSIETLRTFCLSQHLPIVHVQTDIKNIYEVNNIIESGADEVCIEDIKIVLQASQRACQQYSFPALVEAGEQWKSIVISQNSDLIQYITQSLKETFYTEVISSEKVNTTLVSDADLIIMDETSGGDILVDIAKLRDIGIDLPIFVIVENATEEMIIKQYELGIRGFLPKPLNKDQLYNQIKRLLRWGRQVRSLTEYWSDYRMMLSEAEFKHTFATQNTALASRYVEIGACYSGLIHDLRNALGLLEGRLQRVNDAPQLKTAVHFTNHLLEIIAEARFKGAWRVSEYSSENVVAIITSAVENARIARPNCAISLRTSDILPKLIADAKQLEGALTAILLVIAKSCNHLDVSVVPEKDFLSIQISSSDVLSSLPTSLEQATQSEESPNLYLLSAIKLFNRHRASITFEDEIVSINLPIGGWSDDLALRLDIAHFADKVDDLNKKLEKLTPLSQSDNIALFVNEPIKELMTWCDKIVALSLSQGERVVKTARYASLLVRDMLYTSVGYSLPLQSVNLRTVIDKFIDLRGDRLGSSTLSIDVDDAPLVKAEELGILQILVNLTTNAIEAMGGRGELTIKAKRNGEYVRLEVHDTGSGIHQTELPRLFDLFYSTKQGHERGVGLYIVKSLVDQFNGEITVRSTEGEGTTFSIMLPVASPE